MSIALIDNASLTAFQRAVGDVVVKNPDTINGDLVAVENLVQAILFYDELICIDNYKEEHRAERIKKFDFIRFLPNDRFNLPEIEKNQNNQPLIFVLKFVVANSLMKILKN
jgi:hypothetical protein